MEIREARKVWLDKVVDAYNALIEVCDIGGTVQIPDKRILIYHEHDLIKDWDNNRLCYGLYELADAVDAEVVEETYDLTEIMNGGTGVHLYFKYRDYKFETYIKDVEE